MGRIFAYLFFGIFAISGIAAFIGISWETVSFWLNNGYWQKAPTDIIFGSIFLLTHGGAGIGGLLYLFNTPANDDDIPNFDTQSPWLGKRYWASATINSNMVSYAPIIRKIAFYFIGVSVIVSFAVYESVKLAEYESLYGLIIPTIAYLLYRWSQKLRNKLERYSAMPLTLDPHPASIGGQCGGTIAVNRIEQNIVNAKVELICTHHYRSGKNSNRSIEWNEKMVPHIENSIEGHEIIFCFDLEEGLKEAEVPERRSYYKWTLSVEISLHDGSIIKRKYDNLPVFKTAQSSRITHSQARSKQSHATQEMHDASLDNLMPFTQLTSGEYRIHYPAGRNSWAYIIIIVGIIFFISGVLIPDIIFNFIFLIIGCLTFIAGVYSLANSLTVTVSPVSIDSQRYLFGILIKSKNLPSYALKQFKAKKSHSTSTTEKTTQYYNLLAQGNDGTDIIIVENIEGMGQSKAAIKRLKEMISS